MEQEYCQRFQVNPQALQKTSKSRFDVDLGALEATLKQDKTIARMMEKEELVVRCPHRMRPLNYLSLDPAYVEAYGERRDATIEALGLTKPANPTIEQKKQYTQAK